MKNVTQIKSGIKFHDKLNPLFWNDMKLKVEVRKTLLANALEFCKFIDVPMDIKDIVITGSTANYNYTKYSDCDLHIIIDFDDYPCKDIMSNFFNTKKLVWNEQQNIEINSIPLELYVEDIEESAESKDIFSVFNNKWISIPEKIEPHYQEKSIITKTNSWIKKIDSFLKQKPTSEEIDDFISSIYDMRHAGLDDAGEYSTENLTYKSLRNLKYIDKLWNAKASTLDTELSLET